MRFTTYKLYQKIETQNAIGQLLESWEYIDDIEVYISENMFTTVVNDVLYRKFAPSGISTFKSLEQDGQYKISNNEHEYELENFNVLGRYSQFLLKEVVFIG